MPTIKSSADLRNNYNEISNFCHTYTEPVFITKNGYGDMVIMSMRTYEEMTLMLDVYAKLAEAENEVREGKTVDARTALKELRAKHGL